MVPGRINLSAGQLVVALVKSYKFKHLTFFLYFTDIIQTFNFLFIFY
jgi:hypothetical protein